MEEVFFNFISKGSGVAEIVRTYQDGVKSAEDFFDQPVKCKELAYYEQHGRTWMIHECYVDSGSKSPFYFATKV